MKKEIGPLVEPTAKFVEEMIKSLSGKSDEPRKNKTEVDYPAIKNADLALTSLLKMYPKNNNLSEVYLKVVAINALYSTSIYDTYRIAYRIHKLVIDPKLEKNETTLVNEIATEHGIISTKTQRELNFYSFATKYCSFHKPDDFPIYDSYIHNLLKEYNKQYPFIDGLHEDDFRDYAKFKNIIKSFQQTFKLEFSLKEIDKFLWIYSKERAYELDNLKNNLN